MSATPVSFLSIIIIAAVIAIVLSIVVAKKGGRTSTPRERPGSDDFDAQISQLKEEASEKSEDEGGDEKV